MGIKSSTISKVRDLALSDVLAAEGIPMKRIGREAVTTCPWHNDTNPSLTINDDKNLCFCFACGGGSDAISFVQQKFGLSFTDAISRIAEKHNIIVERDDLDPGEALRLAKERRRQFLELETQQGAFRDALRSERGLLARQWLISRKIEPETSREFGIGYAATGYFGGRTTIPIHDHRGNLVGFTGRDITGAADGQKYKNSASSEIFDKSSLVFNENRILEPCRLASRIIFVEGHLDVITMWQHGIRNAVATQGTAAPALESIRRLSRNCKNFVLCYDGDAGGLKATENFLNVAGDLSLSGEINICVAHLPAGMDPDEAIRSDLDINSIIENAQQWIDWKIDLLTKDLKYSDTKTFSDVETAIKALVNKIKSPALRQYYIDKAAKILCESEKNAAKFAKEWFAATPKTRIFESWAKPSLDWTRAQAEKRIIRAYVHFPDTRARLDRAMGALRVGHHSWLWLRIQELNQLNIDVDIDTLKIILAVAEPERIRALRPLLMPTIQLHINNGILDHAERIVSEQVNV